MTTVSIIMSVGNRPKHLRYSLRAWSNINYPDFDFSLIDNGSGNPEVQAIAEEYKEKLHLIFYKEPESLNINMVWNRYGKQSRGEYIIFSMMDEIISHPDIIQKMLEVKDRRANVFVYFMDENQTAQLDTLTWQDDPRIIPKPDTTHTSAGIWSHITGAYREYWDWIGWFRNDDRGHLWVEQDIHLREKCLGMGAATVSDVYCLHQAHASALSPDWARPGYHYKTELQARLLESAERDSV